MFSVSWGGPQKVFIHIFLGMLNYECIALDHIEYQTKYYLQYVKYKHFQQNVSQKKEV